MEKKITKVEYFGMIKDMVLASDTEKKEELVAFLDKQVEIIEAKAEKAKERAADKKAKGDELRETVKALLTDELQNAEEILAKIEDEEVTKNKVTARLTQLVNAGIAVKEQVKDGSRRIMAYKLA